MRLRVFVGVGLVLLCALTVGIVALVASDSAPAEESVAEQGPKVVRELTEQRKVYSSTYLLDNGQFKTVMTTVPIHYQDANGDWQPIDLTLTPAAEGRLEVTKAPVAVSFANEVEGSPAVTLTNADGVLSLDLLDASEDEGAAEARGVRYPSVLPEVDLSYESLGDGLKQTLTLASAKAPETYSFALCHAGFSMQQAKNGQWGLYLPKAEEPSYLLSGLTVFDASADEAAQPVFCDEARLSVTPGKGTSTITYSVPRAWLDDPARIYPVTIDPTLTVPSPTDTYIAAGYPNTSYGSTGILNCGKVSTATGTCKTLVKFPQVTTDIPWLAHVASASLKVRQYWQPATNNDTTHFYRVGDSSTDWTEASTWNTVTLSDGVLIKDVALAGSAWLEQACVGAVQHWVNSHTYNKGFLITQYSSEDATYARAFRSNESPYTDYRPELTVIWEEPSTTITLDKTNATVGETVKAEVTIGNVNIASQITELKLAINRNDGDATRRRGILGWFKEPPAAAGWVYQTAHTPTNDTYGYFAYYASSAYNSDKVTPLLDDCVISDNQHRAITFAFAPNEKWGSPDANKFDTRIGMIASNVNWTSYWVAKSSPSFNVSQTEGTPPALSSVSATTTASSSWFTGTVNDSASEGRGGATLTWPTVPLADSYKVYLWDGAKYNLLATTANESWTVPANIFPTDTQIAALAQGYTGNPYDRSNGVPLRDNPNLLYQRIDSASNKDTDYRFKVVPHNAAGAGADADPDQCAPLRITLDNRTVTANEDPQHVDYEFEEWNGHDLGARLETGALTARTTDLAIASWGPPAEVSRTYLSSETAAGIYAPGWFFNFEQTLQIGQSQIVFTDALRQTHTFSGSGSSWSAPNGFMADLAPDGSNWVLSFFDGQSLVFDSSGTLIALKDDHGNTTSYTWANGLLTTITAANNQEIDLTYASGKLIEAAYTTALGTRSLSYASASPWSIAFYPNTSCASSLTYGYDGSTRLAAITQEDWPSSGNSVAESFLYTSGKLSELHFADYDASTKPDARLSIAYDTNQATIDRYGTVDGTANQVMNREVLVWRGASAGVPYQLISHTAGTGTSALSETYNYAFDRQPALLAATGGGLTSKTIDTNHNLTSETVTTASLQAANQISDYTYDGAHHLLSETSYQSPSTFSRTSYSYSGADIVAEQTVDQTARLLASATYAYDSLGRPTQQRERISESPEVWKETNFSDFAGNGEPESIEAVGVKLSAAATPVALTLTRSYDAFGNLLTETDWSGSRTVQTNTYDVAGQQLSSTDAAGVTSHSLYDAMGNVTETFDSATGTQMKASWTVATYDAMGRDLTQTTKLSDGSGNATTAAVETLTYDGNGQELASNDSTLGGEAAKTLYDADGNVVEEWDEGVENYTTTANSTRADYDAEGNLTFESEVGNPAAPEADAGAAELTYDEAGNLIAAESPDGSKEELTLDAQGNEVKVEAVATDASAEFAPWTSEQSYDAAGQPLATTDADESHVGLTTATEVDLLGRETASEAQRDGQTTVATATVYNDLHWELSATDANGVTTTTTYDAHGQPLSQTVGSKSVTYSYHATTGRLERISDSDGTTVGYAYDAFGNLTNELHETQTGTDLKDIETSYDSLGRPLTESEAVAGTSHTWTYPVNTASGTQESLSYGTSAATSLEIARSGRELESTRTATIASATSVTRAVTARDAADRWTSATLTPTGGSAKSLGRSFDSADRLSSQSGLGLASAGSYSYDPNSGLLAALSLPLSYGGTLAESYAYYPGGRLAEVTTNGTTASYAFDEVGNLVGDVIPEARSVNFLYDAANRLSQSTSLSAEEDAVSVSTFYGWDTENAWRTSQGSSSDPANHETQMTYNALGRMASYANSVTGTGATYGYDATGQRLASSVTVAGTTTSTNYLYDGLSLLALSASQGSDSWKIEYLYDENDVPYGGVYRFPASSSSPTYFSIVTNERGDVLALTDKDGDAFASYRYDVWGSPTSSQTQSTSAITAALASEIAARQILRYASYAFDSESGFYYCSARYYDPATRQWTTGDPAKADGEESSYQYCAGNPVADSDPSGEWSLRNTLKKAGDWAKKQGVAGVAHSVAMVAVPGYDVAYDVIKNKRFTWKSAVSLGTCFIPGGPIVRVVGKTVGKAAIKAAVTVATRPAVKKFMGKSADRVAKTAAYVAEGALWHPRAARAASKKITGTAQRCKATPGHAYTSYRLAIRAAKDPAVKRVHLNHGYNRALGLPARSIRNRRPDVTAVYHDRRVARWEVASKSDLRNQRTYANLAKRNVALNPQIRRHGYRPLAPVVVRPMARMRWLR